MIYVLNFLIGVLNTSTNYIYILFFVLGFGVVLFEAGRKNTLAIKMDTYYMMFVIGLLAMWLWGFSVGLLNGNNVNFVIRNFAGIILYSNFFLLHIANVKVEKLLKTVFLVSSFVLVCVLIARGLYSSIGAPQVYKTETLRWLLGKIDGNDGDYSRVSIRIASESAIFPLVSISLYKLLYTAKNRLLYVSIFLISVIAIIWTRADGYLLALIVLLAFFCIGIFANCGRNKIHLLLVMMGSILLFGVLLTNSNVIINLISNFFVASDEGNAIRYNQLNSIVSELKIFGKGLGATFETINREKEFPYAIEVIYLNIVHKFGIFSLIYFGVLFMTYINCIKNIWKNIAVFEMYVCLGLMSYCVIALGNPILFAPQNVIFHTIVLYILGKVRSEKNSDRRKLEA